MTTQAERAEFFWRMGKEGVSLSIAHKIMRHAATIQRIAEAECNRELTERERMADRRAQDGIVLLLQDIGPNYMGFGVKFSGDPRGCCVKLTVPSGATNDWGQEGICVPA